MRDSRSHMKISSCQTWEYVLGEAGACKRIDFDLSVFFVRRWVSRELSRRTPLIRGGKIAGAARWHWFSANGALQFRHLELTSRKSVNKRSQREYMSRAVSPRLEILRRPERGHHFHGGRARLKLQLTARVLLDTLESSIVFASYSTFFSLRLFPCV